MVAFFSILLAVVLLGITVYGLHRYQTMEVEYTVDRSMPLPPLESDAEPQPDPESPASAQPPQVKHPAPAKAASGKSSKSEATKSADRKSNSQTWLQQVAELKKANRLDDAMAVCQQEFPLWGAYNQACIIERLKLKQAGSSPENELAFLDRLYRLALTAELLHDKSEGSESLPLSQLRKLDLDRIDALDFPYPELGYAHLRLVRKTDIKLMLAHWGRPGQHQLPREFHRAWWQRIQ